MRHDEDVPTAVTLDPILLVPHLDGGVLSLVRHLAKRLNSKDDTVEEVECLR